MRNTLSKHREFSYFFCAIKSMKQDRKVEHFHQIKQMIECILKALMKLPFIESLDIHIKKMLVNFYSALGKRSEL